MSLKQFIIFTLDQQKYAVNMDNIASIDENTNITGLPNSPKYVEGLLNLRGDIIPIVNLKERFALNSQYVENKRILITRYSDDYIGYLVDDASESMSVEDEYIKSAPAIIQDSDNQYIDGVCTKNDEIVLIVDLLKVFSDDELEKILKVRE